MTLPAEGTPLHLPFIFSVTPNMMWSAEEAFRYTPIGLVRLLTSRKDRSVRQLAQPFNAHCGNDALRIPHPGQKILPGTLCGGSREGGQHDAISESLKLLHGAPLGELIGLGHGFRGPGSSWVWPVESRW
jgi:hypothetical protein